MACFFLDLDGTLLEHGTTNLLPGALEFLKQIMQRGDQIVFTTRRGSDYPVGHVYSRGMTERFLKSLEKEHGIVAHATIFDVHSPRIVINDEGCHAVNVCVNADCKFDAGQLELIAKSQRTRVSILPAQEPT